MVAVSYYPREEFKNRTEIHEKFDLRCASDPFDTEWLRPEDAKVFAVFPEVRQLVNRQGLNLSGGQKKMVAIDRAMALAPYLLILDEAFEGLAPAVVKRFRDAVMTIKGMGISLLIAESNLTSAAAIADRLYVVDRGEIVFHGTAKEALGNESVMRALRG